MNEDDAGAFHERLKVHRDRLVGETLGSPAWLAAAADIFDPSVVTEAEWREADERVDISPGRVPGTTIVSLQRSLPVLDDSDQPWGYAYVEVTVRAPIGAVGAWGRKAHDASGLVITEARTNATPA